MNVFYEFYRVVQHLQEENIEYALIGGVAMAFHTNPRFTKDIDFLINKQDFERVSELIGREGYKNYSEPITFRNTNLTLNRFLKIAEDDEMIVDILTAGSSTHSAIIERALVFESEEIGCVRVAAKKDLIWLKEQRSSAQDQVDIESLKNENKDKED